MKAPLAMLRIPAAALALVLAALAVSTVSTGCSGQVASGDATETGNALAGTLILENGGAAVGARVTLVPEGHHPVLSAAIPDSFTSITDNRGRYGIKQAVPGRYNLEAVHPTTGRRLFVQGLVIDQDEVKRAKDTVRAPGSLSLVRPDWAAKEGGFFYVPGSTYQTALETARRLGDRILFDSLPAGMLEQVRYVPGGTDTASVLMAEDAVIQSGAVTPAHPYAAWKSSARVIVNTAAGGVPLKEDLLDFPLLVRLIAPAFDINGAQADGRDLRFAKPDGTPLPFVIEAWERGSVLTWVRMDTVHAGESAQHLTVHWGNAQASLPAMPRVFDTAAGFAGVWHLREEAADTAANGLYKDATQAGNNGNDRIASTSKPGVVGPGHSFAKGDYIQVPNASNAVRLANAFTLSTWFRSQLLQPGSGEMISVGDNYGLRLDDEGRLHTFFWPQKAPAGQAPWYTVGTQGADFLDGNWHLAQGTFDGSIMRLFLDGREMAALAVPGPVDFKFPLNVTLGKHGAGQTGFNYTGDLDEVQIHSKARTVDWNKLSYENQKPGSAFPVLAAP